MWNYAALSKAAKAAGGPEALVNKLMNDGVKKGRYEILKLLPPWLAAAFGAGVVVTVIGYNIYEYFKSEELKTDKSIEETKAELIEGIKAYDEVHPEPDYQGV